MHKMEIFCQKKNFLKKLYHKIHHFKNLQTTEKMAIFHQESMFHETFFISET